MSLRVPPSPPLGLSVRGQGHGLFGGLSYGLMVSPIPRGPPAPSTHCTGVEYPVGLCGGVTKPASWVCGTVLVAVWVWVCWTWVVMIRGSPEGIAPPWSVQSSLLIAALAPPFWFRSS